MGTDTLLRSTERAKRRFAALSYRLQVERFTLARRLTDYHSVCRRCRLPAGAPPRASLPLYGFPRHRGAAVRMVRRPGVAGGAGPGTLWTFIFGALEAVALAAFFASVVGFVRLIARPRKPPHRDEL